MTTNIICGTMDIFFMAPVLLSLVMAFWMFQRFSRNMFLFVIFKLWFSNPVLEGRLIVFGMISRFLYFSWSFCHLNLYFRDKLQFHQGQSCSFYWNFGPNGWSINLSLVGIFLQSQLTSNEESNIKKILYFTFMNLIIMTKLFVFVKNFQSFNIFF